MKSLKPLSRNILGPWNDNYAGSNSQDEEEEEMIEPGEIGKLLQIQKAALENFILRLGPAAKNPVDLKKYAQEVVNICEYVLVDDRKVLELANNTIRKMKNNKRLKRNWNKEDLTILLWVMEHHNYIHSKHPDRYSDTDWKLVAELVPGKTAMQCMFKWLSLKKYNLSEYPWTEKEEDLLRELVEKKGRERWIEISQQLYLTLNSKQNKIYRSPKQCREHWTCYMDPDLKKGPWRAQQDLTLLKQFVRIGKRWSQIAKKLQGRTQNAVKNRFNLLMMKQERVQGRKRSHEHFSQLWINNLELEIQKGLHEDQNRDEQNYPIKIEGDIVQKKPAKKQEEYLMNEIAKAENSADTTNYLSEHESKVTVVVDNGDKKEAAPCRFVKFKKITLNELLKLDDLFPAVFNQQSMEISYKNEPCILNEEDQSDGPEISEEKEIQLKEEHNFD